MPCRGAGGDTKQIHAQGHTQPGEPHSHIPGLATQKLYFGHNTEILLARYIQAIILTMPVREEWRISLETVQKLFNSENIFLYKRPVQYIGNIFSSRGLEKVS